MSELFNTAKTYTSTENDALTYNTTKSEVLNLFALGGALRQAKDSKILDMIERAWNENKEDTLATLLYIRDIRGGLGEKRVFRLALQYISNNILMSKTGQSLGTVSLFPLFDAVVELGSWKDIVSVFSPSIYSPYVIKHKDDENTLMAKWLPSIGGSKNTDAECLAYFLDMTPKEYRKWLTEKRKKLDLIETKLCARKWNEIDYSHVPSQANLIYKNTFIRNDGDRYAQYIQSILNNNNTDTKMNVGTLAPYQIISKMKAYCPENSVDTAFQAMWNSLSDYTNGENALVVADTSWSMHGQPMDVAFSLAIYFSERNTSIFRNEYINFSKTPKFQYFEEGASLREKINIMEQDDSWNSNTDIYKVFKLVLKAAESKDIPIEEMPKTIYIISDMEFDQACTDTTTVFEAIKELYSESKYDVPTLVFWNVNSHGDNLPVQKDDNGTILVSGCSPSVFNMVISNDMNPYKYMKSVIEQDKYKNFVESIMKNL